MQSAVFARGAAAFVAACLVVPSRASAQGGCSDVRGDVDGNLSLNLTDAVYILNHLFRGGPEPVPLCCSTELLGCRADLEAVRAELAACCGLGSKRAGALPRTGQTKCCNTASPPVCDEDCSAVSPAGQDGSYRAGCAADPRFVDNGDGTVSDRCTGLMWQRDTAPGTYSWEAALVYADQQTLAQRGDWRLPNVFELQSLVDYGRSNPAIDRTFFRDTKSVAYWTSTTEIASAGQAWYVDFNQGGVNTTGKTASYNVRLVRSETTDRGPLPATAQTWCYRVRSSYHLPCDCSAPDVAVGQDGEVRSGCPREGRFVDNGDRTVTDTCTGLMWQREAADIDADGTIDAKDGLPWTATAPGTGALEYAESLALAGHTDWRLPNVRELMSLVDHSSAAPALAPVFGDAPLAFWSSTSATASPTSAWYVGFQSGSNGIVGSTSKTQNYLVRAVRTVAGR